MKASLYSVLFMAGIWATPALAELPTVGTTVVLNPNFTVLRNLQEGGRQVEEVNPDGSILIRLKDGQRYLVPKGQYFLTKPNVYEKVVLTPQLYDFSRLVTGGQYLTWSVWATTVDDKVVVLDGEYRQHVLYPGSYLGTMRRSPYDKVKLSDGRIVSVEATTLDGGVVAVTPMSFNQQFFVPQGRYTGVPADDCQFGTLGARKNP